jgi:hypothetical protein
MSSSTTIAMSSMTSSLKQALVTGYPRLADEIGRQPELGIYRKFPALNAQDLLYMQAEIIELEWQLRHTEKEDSECNDEWRPRYSEDWWILENAARLEGYHEDHPSLKQRNLFQRLRPLLAQYSKCFSIMSRRWLLIAVRRKADTNECTDHDGRAQ